MSSERSPAKREVLVHPFVFQKNSKGLASDCLQNHEIFGFSDLYNFHPQVGFWGCQITCIRPRYCEKTQGS